jgi:hypothetical protein
MVIRGVHAICVLSFAVAWAPSGHTQAEPRINIDVSECVVLQSDIERYDCYERLTEAALSAQPKAESSDSPPSQAGRAHTAASSASEAGAVPAGRPSERQTPDEIRSAITELDERRPNEYLITLENGQIWRQSIAKRYPLRVGQDVLVYATRWGDSYRLSAIAANGFIQVERVK